MGRATAAETAPTDVVGGKSFKSSRSLERLILEKTGVVLPTGVNKTLTWCFHAAGVGVEAPVGGAMVC